MAYELTRSDLEALALGGCFFGSGGGGTLESARHLVAHFTQGEYYPSDRVQVVAVEEVTEGESVMVAYLGAPEVIDTAVYPLGPVQAVEQIQAQLAAKGQRLAYVVPPESGALGFVVACLVAARLGLKVVDADGAGRAVPSLPQLTYASAGVNPRPAFLVSQSGLCVELNVTPRSGVAGDAQHQEDVSQIIDNMMRPIVAEPEFNQFGGLAIWIMNPVVLREALPIRGTLSRALALGQMLQDRAFETAEALIEALKSRFDLQAVSLFGPAAFDSASLDTRNGFDVGKISIRAGERSCTVLYQNESLLAWASDCGQPVAMAPDSIAWFVEGGTENVYSNGDLVQADGSLNPALKQRRVSLIGIVADPAIRQPGGEILNSFMDLLSSMGYLGPYLPLNGSAKGAV